MDVPLLPTAPPPSPSPSPSNRLLRLSLKTLMWFIFVAWAALCFFYPSDFVDHIAGQWINATSGNTFGIAGSTFMLFSAPPLIIVFLAIAYLNVVAISPDYLDQKKKTKFQGFRLWTFPIIVDGPFGVVSAAEFIGILIFAVYIVWAIYAYTMKNLSLLPKFDFHTRSKRYTVYSIQFFDNDAQVASISITTAFLFLPVARGSFLLRLIDIPFEHATRYHVWLGHLTMFMFTLHGLFYLWAWTMEGELVEKVLEWKNFGIANLPGVISLLAGLLMWVTSLHPVRKSYFELFFYNHQLYVVFAIFFALHVGDFIFSMAAAGIFLFLLDRFLRFCQSRKEVKLLSATCLPCGTIELVLSKPRNLRYNALSFVFLQIKELSWLQWHPFSVSSSPLDGKHHISVLIKVLGEWTRKLGDSISNSPVDPQKTSLLQPQSRITASVEGPYGHESPYHLTYKNLILVAGGIGISPFLAVLRDILHHVALRRPCMPEKILIVWAVKKSKELSLLSSMDVESICPFFSEKLTLEIQTYVTQELDPPVEDGKIQKYMNPSYFQLANNKSMSGLVGTGDNIWSGIYVIVSTIGFFILLALAEKFYIKPSGIIFGWITGLIFVSCMIASVITFGALVVILWHLWEIRGLDSEKLTHAENEEHDNLITETTANQITLGSLSSIQYGCRPNFGEIFSSVSDGWGHVDVGVIVCGPPGLQTSVAKECRSQNLQGGRNQTFFHFNSHSFDL